MLLAGEMSFSMRVREKETMAKPLDGVALPAYFRRLGYEPSTRDLLIHIRNSPPSRTPGARRGNMPVWYPSKKMQCIIKAESAQTSIPADLINIAIANTICTLMPLYTGLANPGALRYFSLDR